MRLLSAELASSLRRGHVGDAEHHPFARACRPRRCRSRLWRYGRPRAATLADTNPVGPVALELVGGLHCETVSLGDGVECVAALELVDEFALPWPAAAMAISSSRTARLDLALDLVERSVARRRNAGDVVPDVAAVGRDRVVVDADVGGKGGVNHFRGVGKIGDRIAGGIAAGAVDVEGRHRELRLLRRVFERTAAGARVFDLVVQTQHLGLGALGRDIAADLRRDFGERLFAPRARSWAR